jgi:hypothetical protein
MHANSSNDRCTGCGRYYYCRPMDGDLQHTNQVNEHEQGHICPECAVVRCLDTESDCALWANQYLRKHWPLSQTLHTALTRPCLFYPGAGDDIDPALLFANSGAVSTVVYADYIAGVRSGYVFHHFEHPKGPQFVASWRMLETGALRADDFGFATSDAFYPNVDTFGDDQRENRVDPMEIERTSAARGRGSKSRFGWTLDPSGR